MPLSDAVTVRYNLTKTTPKLLDVIKLSYIAHMQMAIRRLCGWLVKLTTRLHLVPRLRMRGDIPLLPLYAFMSWTRIMLLLHLQ
jgi:hypothetical protein